MLFEYRSKCLRSMSLECTASLVLFGGKTECDLFLLNSCPEPHAIVVFPVLKQACSSEWVQLSTSQVYYCPQCCSDTAVCPICLLKPVATRWKVHTYSCHCGKFIGPIITCCCAGLSCITKKCLSTKYLSDCTRFYTTTTTTTNNNNYNNDNDNILI